MDKQQNRLMSNFKTKQESSQTQVGVHPSKNRCIEKTASGCPSAPLSLAGLGRAQLVIEQ